MSTPDELEDALAGMLSGDESGFRFVYRRIQPGLLRYLSVLVGPQDAEDVASESWAQAVRDLERFHGDADGFRAWVTRIARNRALDHLRAHGRRPAVPTPNEELPESSGGDADGAALESMSTQAPPRPLGRRERPDQPRGLRLAGARRTAARRCRPGLGGSARRGCCAGDLPCCWSRVHCV